MINIDINRWNTKHFKKGDKYYCSYCGKEIIPQSEWDEYEKHEYINCDCKKANIEYRLQNDITHAKILIKEQENEIEYFMSKLPKEQYKLIDGEIWQCKESETEKMSNH